MSGFARGRVGGSALAINVESDPVGQQLSYPVIDSHIHLWSEDFAVPEGKGGSLPPESLRSCSSAESVLEAMDRCNVSGALIIQPIWFGFDHSYIEHCLRKWPGRFKAMCLANPSLSPEDAAEEMRQYKARGFSGVRVNAGMWRDKNLSLAGATGRSIFRECGKLGMPVGLLAMQGISQYLDDICVLLDESPSTQVIIDHLGFVKLGSEKDLKDLISLSLYPQVHIKASALFRASLKDCPFSDLKPLIQEIILAFGKDRILWGTDFPWVLDECQYDSALNCIRIGGMGLELSATDLAAILGGTAQKLFGVWETK